MDGEEEEEDSEIKGGCDGSYSNKIGLAGDVNGGTWDNGGEAWMLADDYFSLSILSLDRSFAIVSA